MTQGATEQQNTPPLPGAANLTYYNNQIWYSIGNTVYFTTGALDPSGNGINGTAPGNTRTTRSRVIRLVPSSIGMLVFTLSDVYVIPVNVNDGTVGQAGIYEPGGKKIMDCLNSDLALMEPNDDGSDTDTVGQANAAFIVAAVNYVRQLLAEQEAG